MRAETEQDFVLLVYNGFIVWTFKGEKTVIYFDWILQRVKPAEVTQSGVSEW